MILVSQTLNQPSEWNHSILLFLWLEQKSECADENRRYRARLQLNHRLSGTPSAWPGCLFAPVQDGIDSSDKRSWNLLELWKAAPSQRWWRRQGWTSEVISLPSSLLSCLLVDGCRPTVKVLLSPFLSSFIVLLITTSIHKFKTDQLLWRHQQLVWRLNRGWTETRTSLVSAGLSTFIGDLWKLQVVLWDHHWWGDVTSRGNCDLSARNHPSRTPVRWISRYVGQFRHLFSSLYDDLIYKDVQNVPADSEENPQQNNPEGATWTS